MTLSQSNDNSNYVLIDKNTHEELRKNIEDYKKLIIDFEKVKSELETVKDDNKADEEKIAYYQKQIIELQKKIVELQDKIIKLTQDVQYLNEKLDNAKAALLEKSELYDNLKKLHYRDQAKIYAMKNYKVRFQTQSVIIGFLVVTIVILLGNGT